LRADALDERFGPPADTAAPAGASGGSRVSPDSGGRPPLRTVYFGGGTPSLVPVEWLERLMAIVRAAFGVAADAEVTIEANPGRTSAAMPWSRSGERRDPHLVRRAEPGRAELRRLGRRHSPQDVAEAVAEARAAGIASINLDLLYDVPGPIRGGLADGRSRRPWPSARITSRCMP
jgi:oxygen-independent coproporphyrinogen-3 oxidase